VIPAALPTQVGADRVECIV